MTLWCVYALIDPRDRNPFYIGITANRDLRFHCHHTDSSSAAWSRIQEIRKLGLSCLMLTIADGYSEKLHAEIHEQALIFFLPGLVNRQRWSKEAWRGRGTKLNQARQQVSNCNA